MIHARHATTAQTIALLTLILRLAEQRVPLRRRRDVGPHGLHPRQDVGVRRAETAQTVAELTRHAGVTRAR